MSENIQMKGKSIHARTEGITDASLYSTQLKVHASVTTGTNLCLETQGYQKYKVTHRERMRIHNHTSITDPHSGSYSNRNW